MPAITCIHAVIADPPCLVSSSCETLLMNPPMLRMTFALRGVEVLVERACRTHVGHDDKAGEIVVRTVAESVLEHTAGLRPGHGDDAAGRVAQERLVEERSCRERIV